MSSADDTNDEAFKRLAQYWFRAKLMHDLLHRMLEIFNRDITAINEAGDSWEFMTYLDYWLSALFVVIEGFNKLKLRDPRVQRLFKAHIQHLKGLRHETYHFTVKPGPSVREMIGQLNWAEELHDAIESYIREHIKHGAVKEQVKKFMEWKVRRNEPSAPRSPRPPIQE